MATGLELKRLREGANMSAAKFAALIGVDAGRLRKWEEKDFEPRDGDADAINRFFGLSTLSELRGIDQLPKTSNSSKGENPPLEQVSKDDYIAALKSALQDKEEAKEAYRRNAELERELRLKESASFLKREVFEEYIADRASLQEMVFEKMAGLLKVEQKALNEELVKRWRDRRIKDRRNKDKRTQDS